MKNNGRRISTLGARITSLVSVAVVLVLIGMAALAALAAHTLTAELRSNMGMVIKLERSCTEADVNILKQSLLASPAVERITYTSAADVLAQESEYLGDEVALLADANPYSAEIEVKVRPAYATADSINALAHRYAEAAAIDEIVTENTLVEAVDSTLRRAAALLLCLAAVILAISLALINNTISLSIYSRRFVIHTMKLVGATGAFIRRPFVRAATASGVIAGVVATGVLFALWAYICHVDAFVGAAMPWQAVATVGVLLTALGAAMCAATAAVATGRYLKASYDEMFLK